MTLHEASVNILTLQQMRRPEQAQRGILRDEVKEQELPELRLEHRSAGSGVLPPNRGLDVFLAAFTFC